MTLEITALRVALALTSRALNAHYLPARGRGDLESFARVAKHTLDCVEALEQALIEFDLEHARDEIP